MSLPTLEEVWINQNASGEEQSGTVCECVKSNAVW